MLSGRAAGRDAILSILAAGPTNVDEVYSSGYSNLSYLDIEQRRLTAAADCWTSAFP